MIKFIQKKEKRIPQEVAVLVLLKVSGPNHISTMYYLFLYIYNIYDVIHHSVLKGNFCTYTSYIEIYDMLDANTRALYLTDASTGVTFLKEVF